MIFGVVFLVLSSYSYSAPLLTSKQLCLKQVEETFKLLNQCIWEESIHKNSNFCVGSLTCTGNDPYNPNFYISQAKCSNGRDFCVALTPKCRESMREIEIEECNSIKPDPNYYEPSPPIKSK